MTSGVLVLWSTPRSRSTAFFRMMLERGDITGVHEPFSYLADHGSAEVAGQRVTSPPALLAALRDQGRTGLVFVKETTGRRYPEVLADPAFLAAGARHTFLIRHPAQTIASRYRLDPALTGPRVGLASQYELFTAVRAATGAIPPVLDAADLARDPAAAVAAYCARTGLDFRPLALRWTPGERPEWDPSRDWHADVAASAGLSQGPARPPAVDVARHPVLRGYLDQNLPFYQRLHRHRIPV